jgi:hypothetical protein
MPISGSSGPSGTFHGRGRSGQRRLSCSTAAHTIMYCAMRITLVKSTSARKSNATASTAAITVPSMIATAGVSKRGCHADSEAGMWPSSPNATTKRGAANAMAAHKPNIESAPSSDMASAPPSPRNTRVASASGRLLVARVGSTPTATS